MIVGFFDSGLGGQIVMEEFQKLYPDIEMILEMDRENAPYGGKSGDDIRELTQKGVEKLWMRGADVVILACNTASVHALRSLQQEIYPERHILGVTIPGAEAIVEGGYRKVGILATEATVRIRAYRDRVNILDSTILLEEIPAPGLVPLIEQGIIGGPEIDNLLREYLLAFSPDIEVLVLGCTHYPIIRENIDRIWQEIHGTQLSFIDPGKEAARKFGEWRARKNK